MRLQGILAEIGFDGGQPDFEHPIRLQLVFDHEPAVRLCGSGDGSGLLSDLEPLNEIEFDGFAAKMVDLTDRLDPSLAGSNITAMQDLFDQERRRVGIGLCRSPGSGFYIWVADDEFYWGSKEAIENFDWGPQKVEIA